MKWQHINSGCVDCIFETLASGEERRIAEFYGPDSAARATLAAAAPVLFDAVCKLQMVAEEFQRGFPAQPEWCREIIAVSRAAIAAATGNA